MILLDSTAPTRNSRPRSTLSFSYLLLVASMCAAQAPVSGITKPAQATTPGDMTLIQHIVFIVKENRTFDNYFGTYPGADGATIAQISTGQIIPLGRTPDQTPRDIAGHGWYDAIGGSDDGLMDEFDLIPGANVNGDRLGLSQLTQSDISAQEYRRLANYDFGKIIREVLGMEETKA